jgi:hypothetical protein
MRYFGIGFVALAMVRARDDGNSRRKKGEAVKQSRLRYGFLWIASGFAFAMTAIHNRRA